MSRQRRPIITIFILAVGLWVLFGCSSKDSPTSDGEPSVEITSPTNGASFEVGENVTFFGSATDPEDGNLTGDSLVWLSSEDGVLGTGVFVERDDLSEATHLVTFRATDSGGNRGETSVAIQVSDGPGDTGTIVVDAEPDALNAPWELEGPSRTVASLRDTARRPASDNTSALASADKRTESPRGDEVVRASYEGTGDETLTEMPVGQYTITWGTVSGYVTPSGDAQTLVPGGTITFQGTYDVGPEPPEMVSVPHGAFVMGDGVAQCGIDEHEVTLTHDFYLGQHEVTNQEYMEAVQWAYDKGYVTATSSSVKDALDGSTLELLDLDGSYCEIVFSGGVFSLRDAGHGINPDHPVVAVTWYGAARYCDWLSLGEGLPRAYQHSGNWSCNYGNPYGAMGYRLPTDAEWEYAAQYDDERIYPWGDAAPSCAWANYAGCVGWTSPVGSYPDAPASLGLSDMAGNVSEWCNDWWTCNLGTNPETNPVGPGSGVRRLIRGCSHHINDTIVRCAYRSVGGDPEYGSNIHGFRIARTASP